MDARVAVWTVLAGVFGLAIGSFLNVVIYRVPAGLSVVTPPSQCPNCGSQIRNRHNVPVLGWLMLRGRCYDCKAPISPRYPIVEAVTGLLFAAVTLRLLQLDLGEAVVAYLVVVATLVTLTMIDLDHGRLPASITAPTAAIVVAALAVASAVSGDWWSLLHAVAGSVIVVAAAYLASAMHPWRPRTDLLPFAAMLGAALGYRSWITLALGVTLAGTVGIVGLAVRSRHHGRLRLVGALGAATLIAILV